MESEEKWYGAGLRFSCTQCGNCCTGAPGTVKISDEEIADLARHLSMSVRALREVYTRKTRGYISLREHENYDCVFYDAKKGCTVYEHRPKQCRTWPFWRAVVESSDMWEEEAKECPGMNTGEFHSGDVIELGILNDGTSGYVPK